MSDWKLREEETLTEANNTLQIDKETEEKMKKLGLKAPGMIRGMMDELSEISIIFLE